MKNGSENKSVALIVLFSVNKTYNTHIQVKGEIKSSPEKTVRNISWRL